MTYLRLSNKNDQYFDLCNSSLLCIKCSAFLYQTLCLFKVRDYIDVMLKKAEGSVPKNKWGDTPIVFRATAGLRLLSRVQRDELLEEVMVSSHEKWPEVTDQMCFGEGK